MSPMWVTGAQLLCPGGCLPGLLAVRQGKEAELGIEARNPDVGSGCPKGHPDRHFN